MHVRRLRLTRHIVTALVAISMLGFAVLQPSRALPAFADWANWTGAESPSAGQASWQTFVSVPLTERLSLDVNTANGNLLTSYKLPVIPGVAGLDLAPALRYNSNDRSSLATYGYGYGWGLNMSGDVGLDITSPSAATFVDGTGKTWTFTRSGSTFISPPGIDADLVQNADGSYTLTNHASQGKLQFNSYGYLTAMQDRSGNQITYNYGTNWVGVPPIPAAVTTSDAGQLNVQLGASGGGHLYTAITESGSIATYLTYDSSHNLTGIGHNDGVSQYTNFAYDANHDLTKVTDRLGNVTLITYANGGAGPAVASITQVTNSQTNTGPTWTFAYNGATTTVTDPDNHATTYSYDGAGRLLSTTYPGGTSSSQTWTSDNQVATATTPRGNTTTYAYDSLNRVTQVTFPPVNGVNMTEKWAYANSTWPYQPTSFTDEQGRVTTLSFDSLGRVSGMTGPDGHTVTRIYNSNGTVASQTDENGHTTTFSYGTNGLPLQDTPPSPLGTTQYTFNASLLEASVTKGDGKQTTFTYDTLEHLTRTTYADGTSVAWTYDADGNVTSMVDGTGTTSYTYDSLGDVTSLTLPTGAHLADGHSVDYTYDTAGDLLTKTDSGGTTSYNYDQNGRVSTVHDRGGGLYTLGYDADGNQTSTVFPNGVTETTTLNAVGQVTHVGATNASQQTLTSFTYSYTNPATNQPTALAYSVTDTQGNTTSYSWDVTDQMTQAIKKASGGSTLASYSFGYDPAGNMTSKTVNGTSTTFSYDAADELTGASGGMTRTYQYNANGDRVSSSDGTSINLNDAGQITSITPPGQSAIAYTYTGMGEQQRTGAGSSTYQYDGSGLSLQTDTLGNTYFTTLPGGGVLSETVPSGSAAGTYYFLGDGAGDVAAITNSSGAVSNSYSYDPLGAVTSTGSVPNPFTYQGGMYDSKTGYYYTGSGYYDPTNGQSFGCKDSGWLDPGEDGCQPEDEPDPCKSTWTCGFYNHTFCASPKGPISKVCKGYWVSIEFAVRFMGTPGHYTASVIAAGPFCGKNETGPQVVVKCSKQSNIMGGGNSEVTAAVDATLVQGSATIGVPGVSGSVNYTVAGQYNIVVEVTGDNPRAHPQVFVVGPNIAP